MDSSGIVHQQVGWANLMKNNFKGCGIRHVGGEGGCIGADRSDRLIQFILRASDSGDAGGGRIGFRRTLRAGFND